MPRIGGVNIADGKRLIIGLSYIYGLGETAAMRIVEKAGIKSNPKFSEITDAQIDKIRSIIDKDFITETDLKQQVQQNIRRLKEIGSYRGTRHAKGLPVHGQRTKTNARTKRGKKVTVGSGRKKAAEKT